MLNYIIEQELRRAPSDWDQTAKLLEKNEKTLKKILKGKEFQQYVVVQEGDTDGLAHWTTRILSLVSQRTSWAVSETSLEQADSAPIKMSKSKTLFLYLGQRGGNLHTLELFEKLERWFPDNEKLILSSFGGDISKSSDNSMTFGPAERTSLQTLTPTRLMVASMNIAATLEGKDVLAKRAKLLNQWFVELAGSRLAELSERLRPNIVIAAPKRLAPICHVLRDLTVQYNGKRAPVVDLEEATPVSTPSTIIGVTGKSSEKKDLDNLKEIQGTESQVITFSGEATHSNSDFGNVQLSTRTTDIGRSIHTYLSVQKLFLCAKVRQSQIQ